MGICSSTRNRRVPNYPTLYTHSSWMAKCLTPSIYKRYRDAQTASGYTFDRVIQVGIDNPHLETGCVAGDEESYYLFRDFFDAVIQGEHDGYSKTKMFLTDIDASKIAGGDCLDPEYVLSCRVSAGRNIAGYSLLPHITRAERRDLEQLIRRALDSLTGSFKGNYFAVKNMTPEEQQELIEDRVLFHHSQSPYLICALIARDWPDGRGIWYNNDGNLLVWINEEEHMRVIAAGEGGNLKGVFERLCEGLLMIEENMAQDGKEFMCNEHHGFLSTCPANLGTGIRISARVKLPLLGRRQHKKFDQILEILRLDKRVYIPGSDGEFSNDIFDVSNRDHLGKTEVELVQVVVNGVERLIAIEKRLEKGETIKDLWPKPVSKSVGDAAHVSQAKKAVEYKAMAKLEIRASNFPDLSMHHNILARCLAEDIYDTLKDLKTTAGVTLDACIQSGVDNPGDPDNPSVGVRAGDEESYELFADLFDPVIEHCHNGFAIDNTHPVDIDGSKLKDEEDIAAFVLSIKLRVNRSVRPFSLSPHCSREERRAVEEVCVHALKGLGGSFKGKYRPLYRISQEETEQLLKDGILFEKPPLATHVDIARDWPDARGVFRSKNKKFVVWVNGNDHLSVISLEKGANIKAAFERLFGGLQKLEAQIKKQSHEFMWNEHLGYILTCPSDLGTGLRACVRLKLPTLATDDGLDSILKSLQLQKQEREDGSLEIFNLETLGISETELVQKVIDGVRILISMEKKLVNDAFDIELI